MRPTEKIKFKKAGQIIPIISIALLISALAVLCVKYYDRISVDTITEAMPGNETTAILVMLLLFGLKSLSIVIPCGLLYAASGMIFPRTTALLVNILGTVVMTSIPFWLGRLSGTQYVEKIIDRHPKMSLLKDRQSENSMFFAFILRVIGIFPCDLVSAFFGITTIPYRKYVLGTAAGFLPNIFIFTIMGMSVHDISSPAFIITVCLECVLTVSSCILYWVLQKKQANKPPKER